MSKRWIIGLGALLLVGALVTTGAGIAQAWGMHGGFGPWSSQSPQQHMANQQGQYGPGSMMGSGSGGMMGGYHNGQNQQNPASAAPVTGNTVAIQYFAFQPVNLQVKVGTTVTWTNNDTAPHTVTFRDSTLKSSGVLRQGDTYSYAFTTTGTFAYYCDLHQYMTAQVNVTP